MAQQTVVCPACASSLNEPGDRRCRECNADLPAPPMQRAKPSLLRALLSLVGIAISVVLVVGMLYVAGVGQSSRPAPEPADQPAQG